MDRIERHDILNAAGLAAVLLLMAFLLSMFAGRLFDEAADEDNPVIDKQKTTEPAVAVSSSTTSTTELTTSSAPPINLPNEVTVIVANAARISGIAGKGSALLKDISYNVVGATNANTVAQSIVYYTEGHEGDAAQVAALLQMAETSIAPLPASISFDTKGAMLAVVIGEDTLLR